MTFSDGGDNSFTVPKSQITIRHKEDYVYFNFGIPSGTYVETAYPRSIKYKYSDVTSPSAVSGSDLYALLVTLLEGTPEDFTAEAGQTTFTVSNFTPSASTLVYVDGTLIRSGYSISGQDIVFSSAPGVGKRITVVG